MKFYFTQENTIKILIAVLLSSMYYSFFNDENGSLMLITLTNAIFGIQSKTVDSWIYIRYRLLGTIIGCLSGTLFLYLVIKFPFFSEWKIYFLPFFVYFIVVFSGGEKSPITVRGAVMSFITMALVVAPNNDKAYVFHRILATLVGLVFSIAVNWIIAPKKEHLLRDFKRSMKHRRSKK
ncbi:FUSC family protein [Enterococcus sp. LJL98]